MADYERPGEVRIHPDSDREKLNLGNPDWNDNNRVIVYQDDTVTVDLADRVIQHYIDGNKIEVVSSAAEGDSFESQVTDLPHIDADRAEDILSDFDTWEQFVAEVDAKYLASTVSLSGSQVDDVLEALGADSEPKPSDADESGGSERSEDWDDRVDDYLDQNWQTVTNSLEEDDLDTEFLHDLLEYEQAHRDRDSVVSAIQDRLGA